ncbi:MAG TPA: hypothetical protein VHR47_08845 [Bacillota bacterium]|nr:hypothetical protein [Bacillota bacterium]
MSNYDRLKSKWLTKVQAGEANDEIDYEHIGPGSFCVRIREGGSAYGPFGAELTLAFASAADALGYYRFSEIPTHLHAEIKGNTGIETPDLAETYIARLLDPMKTKFTELIAQLDHGLSHDTLPPSELEELRQSINTTMSGLENDYEIEFWGSLKSLLTCEDMQDRLAMEAEDLALDEQGEADEDTFDFGDGGDLLKLKELLDDGEFDEDNPDHVELAVDFLGKCESY